MSYTLFTWPGIVLFLMSLEKMSFESKNYKRILREDLVKNLGLGELTGLHIDQSQTYQRIEDIMLYP